MNLKPIILSLLLALSLKAQTNSTITLAWNPSTTPPTAGQMNYTAWQGTSATNYTISQSAGTNTSLILSNVMPGTTNYLAVTATDTNTGLTSPFSAQLIYVASVPPIAPTGLRCFVTVTVTIPITGQ